MAKEQVLLPSAFVPDWKKRYTVDNNIPSGISKEVCEWITAKKNIGLINPSAGASLSKIHTYIRQLRVVVITLRAKLDKINDEIKSLSKFREGIAMCLDQLDSELRSKRAEALIKRPRFIKNHDREAKVNMWERNGDSVRMDRSQMFAAQRRLQQEFTTVRNQLQKLSKTRNRMSNTILERSRVLALHAEMVAAGHRGRHNMQAYEKTQQIRPVLKKRGPPKRAKSATLKRQKIFVNEKVPDRSSYRPVKAWENTKFDVMNLPPAYTSQCQDVIQSVSTLNKSTKKMKHQVFSMVEDSLLVPPEPVKPPGYGAFYGVACGGKCQRKNGLFFK